MRPACLCLAQPAPCYPLAVSHPHPCPRPCPVPPRQFLHVPVPAQLEGRRFMDVALWLLASAGMVLVGAWACCRGSCARGRRARELLRSPRASPPLLAHRPAAPPSTLAPARRPRRTGRLPAVPARAVTRSPPARAPPPACAAGLIDPADRLLVNPAELRLPGAGATLIVVGPSKKALARALRKPFLVGAARLGGWPAGRVRRGWRALAGSRSAPGGLPAPTSLLHPPCHPNPSRRAQPMAAAEAERLASLPERLAREAAAREAECAQVWEQAPAAPAAAAAVGAAAAHSSSSRSSSRSSTVATAVAVRAAAPASGSSSGCGDAAGGGGGAGHEADACVPLMVGNPDSESLDADSVPYVPLDTASRLTSPAAVKAFVQLFQRSRSAQREQQQRGAVSGATADRLAAKALAEAAAAEAAGGGGARQASLDYGSCAVDWSGGSGRLTGAGSGGFSAASASMDDAAGGPPALAGHFIVCGAEESFAAFVAQLRKCGPPETPIVILHPTRPEVCDAANAGNGNGNGNGNGGSSSSSGGGGGPVYYVEGSASEAASLRQAGASTARALVYLARAGERSTGRC